MSRQCRRTKKRPVRIYRKNGTPENAEGSREDARGAGEYRDTNSICFIDSYCIHGFYIMDNNTTVFLLYVCLSNRRVYSIFHTSAVSKADNIVFVVFKIYDCRCDKNLIFDKLYKRFV